MPEAVVVESNRDCVDGAWRVALGKGDVAFPYSFNGSTSSDVVTDKSTSSSPNRTL